MFSPTGADDGDAVSVIAVAGAAAAGCAPATMVPTGARTIISVRARSFISFVLLDGATRRLNEVYERGPVNHSRKDGEILLTEPGPSLTIQSNIKFGDLDKGWGALS